MKLYAITASERGKPISKSGNEYITIELTENRENRYSIEYNGQTLDILNYTDGEHTKI